LFLIRKVLINVTGGLKYDDGLHLLMFLIQKTIQQDAIATHSKAIPDFTKSKVNIFLKKYHLHYSPQSVSLLTG
jgi:hypothetical protein